jgi:hypothetical protein
MLGDVLPMPREIPTQLGRDRAGVSPSTSLPTSNTATRRTSSGCFRCSRYVTTQPQSCAITVAGGVVVARIVDATSSTAASKFKFTLPAAVAPARASSGGYPGSGIAISHQ